ncbi:MAG: L-threonylcarbamoyladenylate synthase [Pyrinomonadaceae bacterium]
MKTVKTNSPTEAAAFIKNGGTVAFPTETVYGLGANVFDAEAVATIFAAKRRPADNPLIAHVANLAQIRELSSGVNKNAQKFIDALFPGPLTLVLPKLEKVPLIATAGLDTIGVRMPRHELAHRFLKACGVPVVAPSANLSGRPSPTTWQAVLEDLDGRIDCILQGEATQIGLESTVVDCSADVPVLLRQGAVSLDELLEVVPETVEYKAAHGGAVRSPGLKHRHYSPHARIVLIEPKSEISDLRSENSAYLGLNRPDQEFKKALLCSSVEIYAHVVFEFFRECDRDSIADIYCEAVPESGLGTALMDRLRRAAEG